MTWMVYVELVGMRESGLMLAAILRMRQVVSAKLELNGHAGGSVFGINRPLTMRVTLE
jgi:hypothetical protein